MLRGVRDMREHVHDRIVLVSRVWPGITPFNVFDLPVGLWMRYAHAADGLLAEAASQREG